MVSIISFIFNTISESIVYFISAFISDNESVTSSRATSRRTSVSRESSVVNILEGIPPVFAQPLDNLEIIRGQDFHIDVSVSAQNRPEVRWFKNGKQLKKSKRVSIKTSEDIFQFKYRLEVEKAVPEDEGVYEIIAENSSGSASTTVKVYSEERKKEPTFTQTFEDIVVNEESELIISVKYEGYPIPEIKWFRNGISIKTSRTITQKDDSNESSIIIRNISKANHSGVYKCVAINPIGSCEHSANVKVIQKDWIFIEKLQDLEVEENSQTLLVVKISNEEEDVSWHKDGEALYEDDNRFEFIKEGFYRKLLIKETQIEDEGEYTCLLGRDNECSADLIVIELPPKIISELGEKSCVLGQTIRFPIELSKGDAIVEWYKNDEPIDFDERIDLEIDGKRQELIIRDVTEEDEGIYSCVLGHQTCYGKLKVEPKSTEFTVRLPDNITVDEDNDVQLTVQLSRSSVPVKWFKDSKQIDENVYTIKSQNKKHWLSIKNAKPNDSGEYMCVANGDQTQTQLEVNEVFAEFTLNLRDIIVKEGQTATLTAEVSKHWHKVKWFKDEQLIQSNDRLTLIEEGVQRQLIIDNCTFEDQGIYSVTLKDKRSVAKVTIESAPRITTDRRLFTAKKGDNFVLEIPFEGHLPPKVEWIFEDKVLRTTKKLAIEALMTKTSLIFKNFDDSDKGDYKLRLKNNIGECEAHFTINIIDRPDPPAAPEASDITNNSLVLSWAAPKNNGGSDITNYLIEFREKTSNQWKTYNETFIITERHQKIERLRQGMEYFFRVTAVNEAGVSQPSAESRKITIKESKLGEKPIFIQELTPEVKAEPKSEVSLECKVTGKPIPQIKWFKDNQELLTSEEYQISFEEQKASLVIKIVEPLSEGLYSCKASNHLGSAQTKTTLKVEEKPKAIFDSNSSSMRLKPGSQYFIDAEIRGYPLPTIIWTKEEEIIESSKQIDIKRTENRTQFIIKSIKTEDSGVYRLKLSNKLAEVCYDFILKVLDRPTAPESLKAVNVVDNCIELLWRPPKDCGGSQITHYLIEMKETKKNKWKQMKTIDSKLFVHKIDNLIAGEEYDFRIKAVNEFGESDATLSEPIICKSPFGNN